MNRIPRFSTTPKHGRQAADIEKKFGLGFRETLTFVWVEPDGSPGLPGNDLCRPNEGNGSKKNSQTEFWTVRLYLGESDLSQIMCKPDSFFNYYRSTRSPIRNCRI